MFFEIPLIVFQKYAHSLKVIFPYHLQGWGKSTEEAYISHRELFSYNELEDQVEAKNYYSLEKWWCMKSWLLPLKSKQLPSVPTPNSIDLCHEGLCMKVDTSAHTPNFSLCGYKKAPRSVIHLWEKGQEEEAQVSLDSQFEKIIPRSCVPRSWV